MTSGFLVFLVVLSFGSRLSITGASEGFASSPQGPDKTKLAAIRDDTLLSRSAETGAWNYLVDYLRDISESELETLSEAKVGFLELDLQAKAYRGRVVTITGRVLRCEFRPDRSRQQEIPGSGTQGSGERESETQSFETNDLADDSTDGSATDSSGSLLAEDAITGDTFAGDRSAGESRDFYLCLVRMADNPEILLTLCVLELPEGFPVEDRMNETITATGVFYKGRYYPTEDSVYSSPTILAKTLHWTPSPDSTGADGKMTEPGAIQDEALRRYGIGIILGIILVAWFFARRHAKAFDRRRRERRFVLGQAGPDSRTGDPLFPEKPDFSGLGVLDETDTSNTSDTLSTSNKSDTSSTSDTWDGADGTETPDGGTSRNGLLNLLLPAILMLGCGTASGWGFARDEGSENAEPRINPTTTRLMMGVDEQVWDLLDTAVDPVEAFRIPLLQLESRLLHGVPGRQLLKDAGSQGLGTTEHGPAVPTPQPGHSDSQAGFPGRRPGLPGRMLLEDPARFRGYAFRFRGGHVLRVEALPLDEREQEQYRFDTLYRARVRLPDGTPLVVYTPVVPEDWPRDTAMRQRCGATGVFLQRLEVSALESPGPPDTSDNADSPDALNTPPDNEDGSEMLDRLFEPESSDGNTQIALVLIAPRLEWYPEDLSHPLSLPAHYGLDVGTFDVIPNISLADLSRQGAPGRPRLPVETLRRALWLTESDREPFFQTLAAVARMKPKTLDMRISERFQHQPDARDSVVLLFRNPEECRGSLVRLVGTAKRIVPTLVSDVEVRERIGVERYYQIYLYTPDSQGNPVVVCVPELPPGMPSGTETDFAVDLTVDAFFYKLWAYEAVAPPIDDGEGGTDEGSVADSALETKPRYAPLLIGQVVRWEAREDFGRPNQPGFGTLTTIVLLLLLCAWFYVRFSRKSRPQTEFRLGQERSGA